MVFILGITAERFSSDAICSQGCGKLEWILFLKTFLLFKYSFLPPPHPPALPTSFPCFHPPCYCLCVLYNCSCKPFTLSPYNPLPSPLWSLSACFQRQNWKAKDSNDRIWIMFKRTKNIWSDEEKRGSTCCHFLIPKIVLTNPNAINHMGLFKLKLTKIKNSVL